MERCDIWNDWFYAQHFLRIEQDIYADMQLIYRVGTCVRSSVGRTIQARDNVETRTSLIRSISALLLSLPQNTRSRLSSSSVKYCEVPSLICGLSQRVHVKSVVNCVLWGARCIVSLMLVGAASFIYDTVWWFVIIKLALCAPLWWVKSLHLISLTYLPYTDNDYK